MAKDLASFLLHLLSRGRITFAGKEAETELGMSHTAFLNAAERLQEQKKLLHPRRGFYVVVPPQFLAWGAPPPAWYIDAFMKHESCPYYVGILKAAELHGATHQPVMGFQVVTNKRLPEIQIGRSTISFYYKKNMSSVSSAVEEHKTDTGSMKVASVELAALDLLRYPNAAAGIDNVLTVLADLSSKIEAEKLAMLAKVFPKSVVQRLGHLLDRLGNRNLTEPMQRELVKDTLPAWVELDPDEVPDSDFASRAMERDKRWNVVIRRRPEVDE
jgi:predicted transcriptional regulator of viral defense system